MLNGRCLCGKVRYEVDGTLGPVVQCHCSMCRRATGSAFATNASVDSNAFRVVKGRKTIKIYNSSKEGFRAFCRKCGSPLYGGSNAHPQIVRVRLGSLEDAGGARPAAHIWTRSKAEWVEIGEGLRKFDREPPTDFLMPGASNRTKKKNKK